MDNWDDLKYVVALARFGTMAQAARHLRTNTGTVSRRIKRLSETAGLDLFHKGQNDWELTPEGRLLFDLAARFADDLSGFETTQSNQDSNARFIRVTSVEFLVNEVLSRALPDFLNNHNKITLELSASDQKLSLAFGEADLALRLTRPTEGRLLAKRIANLKMGIYAKKGCKPTAWIGLPSDLDWTPEMQNGQAVFGKPPVSRLASFRALVTAAETTELAVIGPDVMFAGSANLAPLQAPEDMCEREVWLVYHETRKNDPALKATAQWIEKVFAEM